MKRLFTLGVVCVGLGLWGASSGHALILVIPSNPLWTDTSLTVSSGQQLSFSASGTWNWGNSVPSFGPGGDPVWTDASDLFYSGAHHGTLIGYIGADPYQGHWLDGLFFPRSTGYWNIGSSAQFTSNTSGKLWLGFNDAAVFPGGVDDNTGSVTVNIVPEPGTLALVLLGAALLGLHRLRHR